MENPITPPASFAGTVADALERKRHLKEQQVCDLWQIKRAKLWTDVKNGLFPAPLRFGNRCTRWVLGDVLDYMQDPHGWVSANAKASV